MFIAHLPAGYLLFKSSPWRLSAPVFAAGLVGALLPDIDMAYFFLVDQRAHHHHNYLTHRPALWLAVACLGLALRRTSAGRMALALGVGALLHMLLDSVVGQIGWLWPLSDWAAPLVTVQATHDVWVMSFVAHWTFKLEIAITLLALATFWRTQKSPAQKAGLFR